MRIDSVRIGAIQYEVQEAPSSEMASEGRLGDCSTARGRIRITDGVPPQVQAAVLVHEIIHAIFDDSGLMLDRDEEEKFVSTLAPRFTSLLADNRGAIESLWDMLGVE